MGSVSSVFMCKFSKLGVNLDHDMEGRDITTRPVRLMYQMAKPGVEAAPRYYALWLCAAADPGLHRVTFLTDLFAGQFRWGSRHAWTAVSIVSCGPDRVCLKTFSGCGVHPAVLLSFQPFPSYRGVIAAQLPLSPLTPCTSCVLQPGGPQGAHCLVPCIAERLGCDCGTLDCDFFPWLRRCAECNNAFMFVVQATC